MNGNDFPLLSPAFFFSIPIVFFHARILSTSLSGKIRNVDVLWLALSGLAFSGTYWYWDRNSEIPSVVSNLFFFLVLFFWTLKFYGPAYAKYLSASVIPFILFWSVAHFAGLAVLFVFLWHCLSALIFYSKAIFFWNFFGFLRRHVSDSKCFSPHVSLRIIARHVVAFVSMVFAVRIAQFALSTELRAIWTILTPEEWSILLITVGMSVSWGIFSIKDRIFSSSRNIFLAFFGLVCTGVFFVWELGFWIASTLFIHALAMYAFIWAIRKFLQFHSLSDGSRFVSYLEIRPGEHLEKKFLLRMLYDFQFDEVRARSLVSSLNTMATPEWISEFQDFVTRAKISAEERNLPGFSSRTEVLVLRQITLVPQIFLATFLYVCILADIPRFFP